MHIHPVIRIICFLLIVVELARAALPEMLVLFVAALLMSIPGFIYHVKQLIPLILRMRWLWLSIVLLYTFMPVSGPASADFFNQHGTTEGLVRCLGLFLVIMYFVLLVHPIPTTQLRLAWHFLMYPLKFLGLSPDIISRRIGLTFEAVRQLQTVRDGQQHRISFRGLPDHLHRFMAHVIAQADETALQQNNDMPAISRPAFNQWLLPILLLTCLSVSRSSLADTTGR